MRGNCYYSLFAVPGHPRHAPAFGAAERKRNDFRPQSHKPISAQINYLQQFDAFFHNETKHIYRAPSRCYWSEGGGRTCPQKVRAGSPGCSANRFVLSPSPRCSNYGSKKGLGKVISKSQTICYLPANVTNKEVDSSSSVSWLLVEAIDLLSTCY